MTLPEQLALLRKRAADENAPAAERAALHAALADLDDYARQGHVLNSARIAAAAWDDAKVRVEVLDVYAWQVKRGDTEGAELRGRLILVMDALRQHVQEADAARTGEQDSAGETVQIVQA